MYLNYIDFLNEIDQNKICQVETVLLLNSKEKNVIGPTEREPF